MEKRITLRIPIELDNLIQKEKIKRGISKNTLIVEACTAFISDIEKRREK